MAKKEENIHLICKMSLQMTERQCAYDRCDTNYMSGRGLTAVPLSLTLAGPKYSFGMDSEIFSLNPE